MATPKAAARRGIDCHVQRLGTGEKTTHLERYARVPTVGDYVEVRDPKTQVIEVYQVWRVLLATDGKPPVILVKSI